MSSWLRNPLHYLCRKKRETTPYDTAWWSLLSLKWNATKCIKRSENNRFYWTMPCTNNGLNGGVTTAATSCVAWLIAVILIAILLILILLMIIAKYYLENQKLKQKTENQEFQDLYKWARSRHENSAGGAAKNEHSQNPYNNQINNGGPFVHGNRSRNPNTKQNKDFNFHETTSLDDLEGHGRLVPVERPIQVSTQPGNSTTILADADEFSPGSTNLRITQSTVGSPTKDANVRYADIPQGDSKVQSSSALNMSPLRLTYRDQAQDSGRETTNSDGALMVDAESGTENDVFDDEYLNELERREGQSRLPRGHPARRLCPVDLMIVLDYSGSVGIANFDKCKEFLDSFVRQVDIAPGKSRTSLILYATEPNMAFDFDKYHSNKSVRAAIKRASFKGGSTFLGKALSFAAGVLSQEQNLKNAKMPKRGLFLPPPRHDRLQVMLVCSDGSSEDNFEKVSGIFHDKLRVKVAALGVRPAHKEKLLPITRFDGSIFGLDELEKMNNWLWKQQRLWDENYGMYFLKEKQKINSAVARTNSPRKQPTIQPT